MIAAVAAPLIAAAGVASVALIARMLADYRHKIAAALRYEPMPCEVRHAARS